MAALPTGTVTFLFTDVENSTQQWESDPRAMGALLAEHDEVLRSVIASHGGYVFATAGDGVAAAFADPLEAVVAAVEGQGDLPLPVRMGVHTGTAEERAGNYFGRTLNRTARMMGAGHGGQILVSDATAVLIGDEVPLVDLGLHRLADLPKSVRVWQIGSKHFPALRTSGVVAGTLPAALDVFVGRGGEQAQLIEMVRRHRLVTITGAGGVGKTRVAVEVGRLLGAELPGGVWFVDLMVARSPIVVVEQIALSLGVRPGPGQTIDERLVEHLQRRPVLLVVDNCEHVVRAAASAVEMLLRTCPGVRVLATSREPLLVRGERLVALAPLPVDGPNGVGSGDAVVLFAERFQAGADRLRTLAGAAEICRRVDGLALAIELAAARARTLGVDGVRRRLGDHLELLSGGWRSEMDHHRTLQGTLDWSFALLAPGEQLVFDRLGMFVGWFTLDDAIALTADRDIDDVAVVDAVSALVDKSMCTLETRAGMTWYRYLEPIRAYAHEHLGRTPGTLDELGNHHATYFGRVADRLVDQLGSPREADAAADAEARFPDLRGALVWATDHNLIDTIEPLAWLATALGRRGSAEMSGWFYAIRDRRPDCAMTQVVVATHAFVVRGDLVEGRHRAEHVLQLDHPNSPMAHRALGNIAAHGGDFERAVQHFERYCAFAETSRRVIERVPSRWPLAGTLAVMNCDFAWIARQILDDATAAGWPTGIALGHQVQAAATAATNPQHSLDEYTRAIDVAASVGSWYVEAVARRTRLGVQFALLPPDELATATIDVLRRFHTLGGTGGMVDVAHTVGYALIVLADAERLEACAVVLGWLSGRSNFRADPLGRLAEVRIAVEQSLGDKSQSLLETGRSMAVDDVVALVCSELAAITT